MLLGGRADAGADQSTMERLECWSAALQMFRNSPIFGVGKTQFGENHYLTAHNSFMLALGETGLIGLFLFSTMVYLAFKAALTSARDAVTRDAPARVWSSAVFASLCACMVSAFFLSQTDRVLVWVPIGLAAALASRPGRAIPPGSCATRGARRCWCWAPTWPWWPGCSCTRE
jgi:O-antigen ligase